MINDSDPASALDELRDWLRKADPWASVEFGTNVCKAGWAGKGHVSNYLSRGVKVCGSLGVFVTQFSLS